MKNVKTIVYFTASANKYGWCLFNKKSINI